MKLSSVVSKKLISICNDRNISINKLATMSCLTQSTVQNIIEEKSKNPKLLTIARICDGLGIELKDFFNDELFKDIDLEN